MGDSKRSFSAATNDYFAKWGLCKSEARGRSGRVPQLPRTPRDSLVVTGQGVPTVAADWHYRTGKTKGVMLGGLNHSAQRSSIKKSTRPA